MSERGEGIYPSVSYLFKVLKAVHDISTGVLVWQIEHVYCQTRVQHVHSDVAYLPQSMTCRSISASPPPEIKIHIYFFCISA
jgi:hypothetical protein